MTIDESAKLLPVFLAEQQVAWRVCSRNFSVAREPAAICVRILQQSQSNQKEN
jgi:hypothetical protein